MDLRVVDPLVVVLVDTRLVGLLVCNVWLKIL